MLLIAGVQVLQADQLYIQRAGAFGSVLVVGENSATVRVQRTSGYRDFVVEQGGMISGRRDAYWHAPLQLDLPKADIAKRAKVQAVVNALVGVL